MFARIKHWLTHVHKWDIVNQGGLKGEWGHTIEGHYYELRCRECGKMKVRNLV